MGSSRASTPAGRRRTAARRGGAPAARRTASKHSARKPAVKPAPKRQPKKASKKTPKRTASSKPKKQAPKRPAAPLGQRLPRILAIAGIVVALLAAGYLLWFRNSSLVAVENVRVTGMSGPEAERAQTALTKASGEMTTLNVDEDALRASVAGLPTVLDVDADAGFPHDLAITVTERPPVIIARAAGQAVPIAGDGTVLNGVDVGKAKLPSIGVDELPAKGKVAGDALEVALVMGAAPVELRDVVEDVAVRGREGVRVTLRGEIPVHFGGSEDAAEKWAAAAAVLADRKIDTLTYLDVRVPGRPAIGGAAPPVTEDTTDATEPETAASAAETP